MSKVYTGDGGGADRRNRIPQTGSGRTMVDKEDGRLNTLLGENGNSNNSWRGEKGAGGEKSPTPANQTEKKEADERQGNQTGQGVHPTGSLTRKWKRNTGTDQPSEERYSGDQYHSR